jgi:hypothetical protein
MAGDTWGFSWGGAPGIWGVSWGGSGIVPAGTRPVYGAPFITLGSPITATISRWSEVTTTITRRSEIDEDA